MARDLRAQDADSLLALIKARRYRRFRSRLGFAQLKRALAAEPKLIEDWLRYSTAKRTTAGWVLDTGRGDDWVVRQPAPLTGEPVDRRHRSALDACADFVLTEFNYWLDFDARMWNEP
jgi:hypothetical protein